MLQSNTFRTVDNIVFLDKDKRVMSFQKFPIPLLESEVKPEELYGEKFTKAIVQYSNGGAYMYVPTKKIKHAA